jgi:hypothetical protein
VDAAKDDVATPESAPPRAAAPSPQQTADAVRIASDLFAKSRQTPRWPMYIRQMRQFFRNADDTFDERKLGFPGIVDFLRACQREGLLRLDRDRQGVLRVFPGTNFGKPGSRAADVEHDSVEYSAAGDVAGAAGDTQVSETRFTRVTDAETTPIIDATAVETRDEDLSVGPGNVAQPHEIQRKRTRKAATPRAAAAPRKGAAAKTARAPRPRKNVKAKPE